MKLTINVTEAHIARGKRNGCTGCPIALAIREQTEYKNASVGYEKAWKVEGSNQLLDTLPASAFSFREAFDFGRVVAPISFDLFPRPGSKTS